MTWIIVIIRPAEKELNKIYGKDLNYVRKALVQMKNDPFSGDVVRLKGQEDSLRKRVGDWRIFFGVDFNERIVFITSIVRRTSNT